MKNATLILDEVMISLKSETEAGYLMVSSACAVGKDGGGIVEVDVGAAIG